MLPSGTCGTAGTGLGADASIICVGFSMEAVWTGSAEAVRTGAGAGAAGAGAGAVAGAAATRALAGVAGWRGTSAVRLGSK